MIYTKTNDYIKQPIISSTTVKKQTTHHVSTHSMNNRDALGSTKLFRNNRFLAQIGVTKGSYTPKDHVTPFGSRKLSKDIRYNPQETERTIRRAAVMLHMKKLSDIANYNQTDNNVLQQQIKLINNFNKTAYKIPKKQKESAQQSFQNV